MTPVDSHQGKLSRKDEPQPPIAPRRPHRTRIHGVELQDDYHWMRQRGATKVLEYLKAENAYTETRLEELRPLRKRLYEEMLGRIQQTDTSVPARKGEYFYYTRTEEGKQYPIYCRKKGSLEALEEILLDLNQLAAGHEYFALGVLEVSPDHRLLAYSTDTNGFESYTLRVKDLTTGQLLPDRIAATYYSVEWANDNRTLFYNVIDDSHRPFKLFKHRLGQPADDDALVYHEQDEAFFLNIYKTRSERFLILLLESNTTSEAHFLAADQPDGKFKVIEPRRHQVEYSVTHHGDHFYITTNDEAVNFRLMRSPIERPRRQNWEEVLPHQTRVRLEAADFFENHMAVFERREGYRQVWVRDLSSGRERRLKFDEPIYTVTPGINLEFGTTTLRVNYSSLVTPRSIFDVDMDTGVRELKKQTPVLGGYEPEHYRSQRLWATSADGVKVPISLVYNDQVNRRPCPLLLYGYGAYGASIDPQFDSNRISLLDRGVIFAIAHVRGGGELGRPWYDEGKLLKKKNSFVDFIAASEHLISQGYTTPELLAVRGGSAGGLLLGTVLNQRPQLFRAAVANVPFVDVINTMLDASIPLTVPEYEEWGNPREKQFFEYLLSYSPYENVSEQEYPDLLVTTGLNDPRVSFWEPAKWVARLRAVKKGDQLLLLKTNMDAGHAGASGRFDRLREIAFEYAFLLNRLGICE